MDFRAFYDTHVRFVWRALLRLGVAEREVPDAVQDVFLVVHRRLPEFEGRSKVTTWLFGICLRVASDRRRLAHSRYEELSADAPDLAHAQETADPVALAEKRRARSTLEAILERMPEEQRIVFSLFELEGMTGDEIAELLDVPVGTIRSRLRLAREAFQQSVDRLRAREEARARAPAEVEARDDASVALRAWREVT
ncbi:MAG: sigma-70 family RNA polymerase sigma factor [Deltaproteobacteria bacterium]|nr:sigma-70 family RNA polymerase sigma factor [Deltaproteobacteria bacterium]